jgi:L-seryl-tRNA(Ser) seleniumtransferase
MDAAWANAFSFNKPKAGLGRPMKVCKEEIVGLIAALELFVEADHEAEWAAWRAKSSAIVKAVQDIPALKAYLNEGPVYPGPNAPTAMVCLDESWSGPSPEEIDEAMRLGDPPIYIGTTPGTRELWVAPVALQDGEEAIVARRLVNVLTSR